MDHIIHLNRYTAIPAGLCDKLKLGTAGSYGTEQLEIHPKADWEGLAVTVTFHPPGGGEPVRMLAGPDGLVTVPPEATAAAGEGQIVFAGLSEGVQRISCDLAYRVEPHAGVEGAESAATPTLLEQAVTAAAQSALAAQKAAGQTAADAANAAASQSAAAQSEATAAQSAAQAAASASAAAQSAALAQGAARGCPPQLSERNTWLVFDPSQGQYIDSGVSATGADGYTPVKGVDYWTEEECAQMLEGLGGFAEVSNEPEQYRENTLYGQVLTDYGV